MFKPASTSGLFKSLHESNILLRIVIHEDCILVIESNHSIRMTRKIAFVSRYDDQLLYLQKIFQLLNQVFYRNRRVFR